eukprot:scaffold12688_cov146-Isochrysis_galbana.AAC.9
MTYPRPSRYGSTSASVHRPGQRSAERARQPCAPRHGPVPIEAHQPRHACCMSLLRPGYFV